MHRQQQQQQQQKMEDVEMMDENDVERILSRAAFRRKFDIFEAPEFIQRLNSYREAEAGESVTFSGQYRAFPKPTVKWFKDEEEILETVRHQLDSSSEMEGIVRLIINDVCRRDEGAYKCKVENQEGVASTTGYLSVIGKSSNKTSNNLQPRKVTSDRVSTPPYLRPIAEQKSMEEKEEKEYERLPPSPLQEFIDSIRHCAKSMHGAIDYGNLEYLDNVERLKDFDDEDVFSDGEISKSNAVDPESSEDDEILTENDDALTESETSSDQESIGSQYQPHYYSVIRSDELCICAVDSFVSPSVDLISSALKKMKDGSVKETKKDEEIQSRLGFEEEVLEERKPKTGLLVRRSKLALQRSLAIELPDQEHPTMSLKLNTNIAVPNDDDDVTDDVISRFELADSSEDDGMDTTCLPSNIEIKILLEQEDENRCASIQNENSVNQRSGTKNGETQTKNGETQTNCSSAGNIELFVDSTLDQSKQFGQIIRPAWASESPATFEDIFPMKFQGDLVEWLDVPYVQFYLLVCVLSTALALAAEVPPGSMIPAVGLISFISFILSPILDIIGVVKQKPS